MRLIRKGLRINLFIFSAAETNGESGRNMNPSESESGVEEERYKRINILIRPEQHENVVRSGLSLSGLVRDLLDDRFSDSKIILSVSKKSKRLYDYIVSNFGVGDEELEKFFVEALDRFLDSRSKQIDKLRTQLKHLREEV